MKRRKLFLIMCVIMIMIPCNVCSAAKKNEKPGKPILAGVLATSRAEIKLSWTSVKYAQKYIVYRADSRKGKYKKIATTKKTQYTDKKGKQLHTYYYKVRAVRKHSKTNKWLYGSYSNIMKKKVRKIAKKTAYAGDSLTVGLLNYGKVKESRSVRVFAKIGIGTAAFYKSDYMKDLLRYNPDRLFIMLGVNDLAGNPTESYMDNTIRYYKQIVKVCLKKNPNMEIFVMGVAPVEAGISVNNATIKEYNRKLEDSLLIMDNVYYYDLALELAGEDGCLKPQYAATDGLHWNAAAYDVILKAQKKFVLEY